MEYSVYESNAGDLFLCVYDEERCIWVGDYSDNTGRMQKDIRALKDGRNPVDENWDALEIDESFDDVGLYLLHTASLIADESGTYPENMGVAGKIEFMLQ